MALKIVFLQSCQLVNASVADVRVEHVVKFADFMKCLDRQPRSLQDMSARHEICAILGTPDSGALSNTSRETRAEFAYEFHSAKLGRRRLKESRH
jgi:hypothetical protein